MNVSCRWEVLLISLWIQVGFVSGILCKYGTVCHLSREDDLLIKNKQDPKCFLRPEQEFTCFFETTDNRTYDLLYKLESPPSQRRYPMSVQRTEEGTFLQIGSFPDTDVVLYVEISLEVVERNTNISLYNWTLSMEDHSLLDPPFSVALHQNGKAGQLRVSWDTRHTTYCIDVMHRIRYSSKGLGERTKEHGYILDSLVPGEVVQVQLSVKCNMGGLGGYWSSWSHPVQNIVPQSADDVSLICYTSDLQNITCQWNGSKYGEEKGYNLFYKTCLSPCSNTWTGWAECLSNESLTDLCHFIGDKSREVIVMLSGHPAPLSRTFYTQKFTLNNSIKTSPPVHLRGAMEKDNLCLQWDAPFLSVLAHLQYEVGYQKGSEGWMAAPVESPANEKCLKVAASTQYSVKVRAKPTGSIYSGYWSDWSDVLTGEVPSDIGLLLILCIPVLMVITAVLLISLFSMYLSKLKQYFWPPVPNLEKVLQSFLTEINGQKWDLPVIVKQCSEEAASSVVEIMSEDKVSGLGQQSQESTQLLSPEGIFSSKEKVDECLGTDSFPDYVTLNKDCTIVCPKGNKYVYEQVEEKADGVVENKLLQTCHCSCTGVTPCSCTEYLNHSYLPLAEAADRFNCKVSAERAPVNPYTNFPCS